MIPVELDPNLVKPGWTALIIVIVLAAIMVFLFISMMRQMRRIKVPRAGDDDQPPADGTRAEETGADEDQNHENHDENHKAT